MKAKLIKAVALASLGAFLTVGIGANVAHKPKIITSKSVKTIAW